MLATKFCGTRSPKTGVGVGTVKKIHDTELTPVVFPWSRGRRKIESIDSTEKWRRKRNKEQKYNNNKTATDNGLFCNTAQCTLHMHLSSFMDGHVKKKIQGLKTIGAQKGVVR